MNYSEWSSHEYNSYKNDPKHYNSSSDNHGLANDRLGLVMNHLGETRTNLNKESVHEFVQDAQGWMKRMNNL